jgi:ribonuclease III
VIWRINYLFCPNKKLYKSLKKNLGFYPNHIKYYELAFVHRSASVLNENGELINNERLEYLGDSVLDTVISDFLYHQYPDTDEGFLTQMRAKIVSGEKLSELARKVKIHRMVISNTHQNTSKRHIYEDAFEAFIGAMYLDKGFYGVKKYVINHILKKYIDIKHLEVINTNYKSQIIEWGQKFKKEISFFTDLESFNSRFFISYVRVDSEILSSGTGLSKKEAEQKAAKAAMQKVDQVPIK